MKDAKKTKVSTNKNTSTESHRRSEKYEEKNKNLKSKTVTHEYKNNKTVHEKDHGENMAKRRKKEKIDKNTLILFGVIAFVVILLFLKSMGLFMTLVTIIGIALIIACSSFLKKLRKHKIARIITNTFTILFLLGCIAGVCGVTYFAYIIVTEAPDWNTKNLNTKETSILYTEDGVEYAKLSTQQREIITYDKTSENLINAIIAVEDSRYFQHNGFDPLRFFKASIGQLAGNSNAGGASTISMQVVKNSFTDSNLNKMDSEGIKRKFTDIYLAVFKLEKEYTKEQIFEFYINNHFLGSNAYGVEQASQTYFGKSAADLTISEAALIAGMFQAPNAYNPFLNPDAATERRADVIKLMYDHGYITEEEQKMALSIPIESLLVETSNDDDQLYQSYIDTVVEELKNKYNLDPYTTSLKIYTNIDTKKQQGLDDIFSGKTFKWENSKVQSGIAAVDVWTGKIVAIAGGRNTVKRGLNRATQLNKQIGSTAKPIFDYGPAMEYNNYSTYTLINDAPYTYSSGQPIRNSDRGYMGVMTVRNALAQSRNVPALKTFQSVKNSDIYNFVTSLGITPETTENSTYLHEAHAIGSFNGASPLQMAAAYAAFANGGIYYEPYTINKIVYRDTGETIDIEPNGTRVMSDSTAFMITYCLRYAVTNGLSKGAAVSGINVAAKTGTTNFTSADAKRWNLPSYAVPDAWIVGYDPDTALGMWYGYDKIQDGYLKSASSGFRVNVQTERNRLYQTAGKAVFSSKGKDFNVPNSVIKVGVEMGTNPAKLASAATPSNKITYEYFKKGTEPTEVSNTYNKLANVKNLSASFDASSNSITLTWSTVGRGSNYDESYGDIIYKIYRNNSYVGMTKDNKYTLSGLSDATGTYKVVTSYENYSDTDSKGATVTVSESQTDTSTYNVQANVPNRTHQQGQVPNSCLINGSVGQNCVILTRDGEQVNDGYTVTVKITDADGDTISLQEEPPGSYKATFTVKYNGKTFTTSINITIN